VTFQHSIRVRYGECDMQEVVFNSHYLAYVDDALEHWLDARLSPEERVGFDVMLKKATVEWVAPARYRDHVTMDVRVARWGNASFDVVVDGQVRGGRRSRRRSSTSRWYRGPPTRFASPLRFAPLSTAPDDSGSLRHSKRNARQGACRKRPERAEHDTCLLRSSTRW
jgi:acyl-CoA thioester hydrolase